MNLLAQQQQALLDALLAWPADLAIKNIANYALDTSGRGLIAYQSNAHMLAQRTLEMAYPVVAELLGEESFGDLARALWHAHPPQRGDLAHWGSALPAFLRSSAQTKDDPYLPDVADLEWALHACATAADAQLDAASLALLGAHDPAVLRLQLAPGWSVVPSAWPVVNLWTAHREQAPPLAEVGQQMRQGLTQDAVVWRQGLRPRVREALPGELAFLQLLHSEGTLQQALDGAPALDISQWLTTAVQTAWLVGVVHV